MNKYYVYILSCNDSYNIGMTEDLVFAVKNHFDLSPEENVKLVFYEIYTDKKEAEERLTEMKNWMKRKINLIVNLFNPKLNDWSRELFKENCYRNFSFFC